MRRDKCVFPAVFSKIVEHYGTQADFARRLKTSTKTLSFKMTGRTDWTLSDIITVCELLDIPFSEIGYYFIEKRTKTFVD